MLNRAWYAGAYTFQTNMARAHAGRVWPPAASAWNNSSTISEVGDVVLVDGAKRARTVWPGDMAISVPTGYVAIGDTIAAKNAIQTLFDHQGGNGELPYAGPPMNFGGSDTYHLWTLLGAELCYRYSGDNHLHRRGARTPHLPLRRWHPVPGGARAVELLHRRERHLRLLRHGAGALRQAGQVQSTFGDPLPNVAKSCQVSDDLYTECATEGGTCAFTGAKQVRFGANGQWMTHDFTGGTPCDSRTFGDPLPGVVKRCEVR